MPARPPSVALPAGVSVSISKAQNARAPLALLWPSQSVLCAMRPCCDTM
jgi:hypothetical protein